MHLVRSPTLASPGATRGRDGRVGAGGGRAGGGRRRRGACARDGEEGGEQERAHDSHAPECTCRRSRAVARATATRAPCRDRGTRAMVIGQARSGDRSRTAAARQPQPHRDPQPHRQPQPQLQPLRQPQPQLQPLRQPQPQRALPQTPRGSAFLRWPSSFEAAGSAAAMRPRKREAPYVRFHRMRGTRGSGSAYSSGLGRSSRLA